MQIWDWGFASWQCVGRFAGIVVRTKLTVVDIQSVFTSIGFSSVFTSICYPLGQQEAGISKALAPTIGIAVDHRRRNRSLESLQVRPLAVPRLLGAGFGMHVIQWDVAIALVGFVASKCRLLLLTRAVRLAVLHVECKSPFRYVGCPATYCAPAL